MFVDLHIHSYFSDGAQTPEQAALTCRDNAVGLAALCLMMNNAAISFGVIQIPIELFALFAMIPICLYSGRKATASRAVQLGFYLFYPVHLAVLAVIMKLCFGG